MIRKEDIPEIAICHICGEPMQVFNYAPLAKKLGFRVTGASTTAGCCGYELTYDGPEEFGKHLVEMLLEYHAQKAEPKPENDHS